MKKKFLIPLVLFLGLSVAFIIQLQRNAQGDNPKNLESALIGKSVPSFKMESVLNADEKIDENVLKTGSPKLLNVWATWCPTCYAEHGFLTKLAEQGVEIVGIDYKDDRAKAVRFLAENQNPYKAVIFDQKGALGLDLGVYGAPETFVVDGKGVIHYRHTGDINEVVWQKEIKPLYEKLKQQTN